MINKNISFVINSFPQISETFIVNQIIGAISAGYSVNIYANEILKPENSSQYSLIEKYDLLNNCKGYFNYSSTDFSANLKEIFKIFFQKKTTGIKHFFNCLKLGRFGLNGFNLYEFLRTSVFLKNSTDIYHAQYGPNGRFLVEAKEYGAVKAPIITTFHGYDTMLNFDTIEQSRKFYESLFKSGDLFTANTPYLTDQLVSLGCPREKLYVVPMGVDTSFFVPDTENKKRHSTIRLLSVGRLVEFKSFHFGIMAVRNLISEGFDIHYTIIGEGDQKPYLINLVKEFNISSHVIFTGVLSQKKILKYMQQSDVFLMTSTCDKRGRRETQGVVTIEAQACGLPVCAFRSGGVPYTIQEGKTGFIAEEKNLEEFFSNIKKIINDEKLMFDMSINARKFIEENYSLSVCSKKMINLYEELTNKR